MASQTRLAAEVYTNTADVSRDVDDPTTGHTVKEIIGVNGVGRAVRIELGLLGRDIQNARTSDRPGVLAH